MLKGQVRHANLALEEVDEFAELSDGVQRCAVHERQPANLRRTAHKRVILSRNQEATRKTVRAAKKVDLTSSKQSQ